MLKHPNLELTDWLHLQGAGKITDSYPQAGGSINQASVLTTLSGQRFFLKQNNQAPNGMFQSEAQSLQRIAASQTLPVPEPHYWNANCLLMELVEPGPKIGDYWERLGEGLALMHRNTREEYGLEFSTYCGTTLQQNNGQRDGYQFFTEQRLLPLGKMALSSGLLKKNDFIALENLCSHLPQLIPFQPASLIHGDLWSGNVHINSVGGPVLIDPALYFGWREAEIAMTRLFGGFPDNFYTAYHQSWPLEQGWQDRCEIYNLYHLLNHLNLFGSGYLAQTHRTLQKYS